MQKNRQKIKCTQNELAKEAGLTIFDITRVKLGRNSFRWPSAKKLADVLGCDPVIFMDPERVPERAAVINAYKYGG